MASGLVAALKEWSTDRPSVHLTTAVGSRGIQRGLLDLEARFSGNRSLPAISQKPQSRENAVALAERSRQRNRGRE